MEDAPLVRDIKNIMEKRDYMINHLKDTLELNFSEEIPRKELEEILKINKQLKLLEDQLILE